MSSEKLETKVAILEANHNTLMEKLNEYQSENREQHKELKEIIEKALAQKANVWVEKAFTWLLYTVGGIIVTALMYLILKQ